MHDDLTPPSDSLLGLLDEDHLHALASEVVDRRAALRRTGELGAKALLASVPLALASVARPVFGQAMPPTVTEVLNFALTLEYLEAEFYRQALASDVPSTAERAVFETIAAHEQAHVDFLRSVLGSDAVSSPTFDLTAGGAFNPFDPSDIGPDPQYRILAQAFEDTGVRAYKGQVANLQGTDVLGAALQIHSVEARHAAYIRSLRGVEVDPWIVGSENTTGIAFFDQVYAGDGNQRQFVEAFRLGVDISRTDAYDEPLTMEAVLAILSRFTV